MFFFTISPTQLKLTSLVPPKRYALLHYQCEQICHPQKPMLPLPWKLQDQRFMQSLKKAINLGPRDALPKATQPKLARPVSARLATGASLPADESPSVESKEVASADSTVDEAAVRPMERGIFRFGGSSWPHFSVFFSNFLGCFRLKLFLQIAGFLQVSGEAAEASPKEEISVGSPTKEELLGWKMWECYLNGR